MSFRTATDAANERAFKAAISISYLGEDGVVKADDATVCVYDAVDGKVVADDVAAGYGQNSDHAGSNKQHTEDQKDDTPPPHQKAAKQLPRPTAAKRRGDRPQAVEESGEARFLLQG